MSLITVFKEAERLLLEFVEDDRAGLVSRHLVDYCSYCGDDSGPVFVKDNRVEHTEFCPIKQTRIFLGLVLQNGKWIKPHEDD